MYIPESKLYKPNTTALPDLMNQGEFAIAMVPIGFNSKVLTNQRLLFLDTTDSSVKEFMRLDSIETFEMSSFAGAPRLDAVMTDGSKIKIGSVDKKWAAEVLEVFQRGLGGDLPLEANTSAGEADAAKLFGGQELAEQENVRTNSKKTFPKWLQKSIHDHKRADESLLMVITEPYTNHQGALLVFRDRCMIVKGGFIGGFMAGSLGGERAATFYLNQITGIEYNSGFVNGVLEVLTSSYQGGANKDFWRGTNKSRNADSNDPWTLSNCLPLTKDGYQSAKDLIEELKDMIAKSNRVEARSEVSSELTKLSELHSQGFLTDEEFSQAKARLLS